MGARYIGRILYAIGFQFAVILLGIISSCPETAQAVVGRLDPVRGSPYLSTTFSERDYFLPRRRETPYPVRPGTDGPIRGRETPIPIGRPREPAVPPLHNRDLRRYEDPYSDSLNSEEVREVELEEFQKHLKALKNELSKIYAAELKGRVQQEQLEDKEVKKDLAFYQNINTAIKKILSRTALALSNQKDVEGILGKDGPPLMHFACTWGSVDIMTDLLKLGSSVSQQFKGVSPLCQAVANMRGDVRPVSLLVKNGASVSRPCAMGRIFPLFIASYLGNSSIVKYLLDQNAPLERGDGKHTPLYAAMSSKNYRIAHLLRKRGAATYEDEAANDSEAESNWDLDELDSVDESLSKPPSR